MEKLHFTNEYTSIQVETDLNELNKWRVGRGRPEMMNIYAGLDATNVCEGHMGMMVRVVTCKGMEGGM